MSLKIGIMPKISPWYHIYIYIDGLVQDCSNSIANALELLQSCTKLPICLEKHAWNEHMTWRFFSMLFWVKYFSMNQLHSQTDVQEQKVCETWNVKSIFLIHYLFIFCKKCIWNCVFCLGLSNLHCGSLYRCNRYHSNTSSLVHMFLRKSSWTRKTSFGHNVFHNCQIVLKCCKEHDNNTCVPCKIYKRLDS